MINFIFSLQYSNKYYYYYYYIPAFAFEDTSIGFKLQIVTAGKSDIVSCNFVKSVIVPY